MLKNFTSIRVIYGDTDQMGIVYYANYLRWFERGRSEFLRQIGVPYAEIETRGFHFPVIEASCRYIRPARYDDIIRIETELAQLGRVRLSFNYRITRDPDDTLLATGSTKHACVDADGRPVRIPGPLERAIGSARTAKGSE